MLALVGAVTVSVYFLIARASPTGWSATEFGGADVHLDHFSLLKGRRLLVEPVA